MYLRRRTHINKYNSPLKIVLIGDGMAGKSAMCKSYIRKAPYMTYQPTISETHEMILSINKRDYSVVIWDTAGVEEWDRLRVRDYDNTDCFMLCYAINNPTSFSNVETKWVPELRKHCPNVPILLVGTKADCRTPENRWITDDQGNQLKGRIKASGFAECTSKSIASIEGVLIQATVIADKHYRTKQQQRNKKRCNLL